MSTKPYRMLILHVPAKHYRMIICTHKALGNANSESGGRKWYSLSTLVSKITFYSRQQNSIGGRLEENSDLSNRSSQMLRRLISGRREAVTYGLLRCKVRGQ